MRRRNHPAVIAFSRFDLERIALALENNARNFSRHSSHYRAAHMPTPAERLLTQADYNAFLASRVRKYLANTAKIHRP